MDLKLCIESVDRLLQGGEPVITFIWLVVTEEFHELKGQLVTTLVIAGTIPITALYVEKAIRKSLEASVTSGFTKGISAPNVKLLVSLVYHDS